ncbi:uncharacterized protein TNCV_4053461 [Trichonephila clavipes]|nr:uncharacterized protein TNCV_4053461 [Trichonephila clavipes]
MATAVLADSTRALQGTNRGSRPAMEESENDVGSLEKLLLYADEHYLARKLSLGDHLGKNNCYAYLCSYRWTSHRGVHKCLPHDPSILSPRGLPGHSRPGVPRMGTLLLPLLPTISNGTLRTIHLAATPSVNKPAVFIPMIRPLSTSLNCEKCLLARLPGMFRLPKSSYKRRVIVPFINLRICAGLYSTLFLIAEPPRRV